MLFFEATSGEGRKSLIKRCSKRLLTPVSPEPGGAGELVAEYFSCGRRRAGGVAAMSKHKVPRCCSLGKVTALRPAAALSQ